MTSEETRPVVSVMLAVPDVPAAMDWYKRALGAKELWSLGEVAGLEIAGAPFFLGQPANNGWESPTQLGMPTCRVEVFSEDPDAFVTQAYEAGAQGNSEMKDHKEAVG